MTVGMPNIKSINMKSKKEFVCKTIGAQSALEGKFSDILRQSSLEVKFVVVLFLVDLLMSLKN